ncbi:Cof-type HAD-IIB family hydrolase [Levilactobacillus yiduensis]|uniref:Cof-type HAD-IIB family hydrolase n=1 Tax=Levilactobacillus yiduensis TaxID=2953880 RepID=UPI000EF35853|nr:Cof-type HAD-IIB family hydrolase [Levilactobacillus yiduensis]AYM03427.1 HAD family hydrolase [Levilactobacillus brevis]
MTIKLIATDLNGTLLHDDQSYNRPLFRQVLRQLQARQIPLVLASGNEYGHLRDLFAADLTDNMILVAENGASIYQQDQLIFDGSLRDDDVTQFVTVDRQQDFLRQAYVIMTGAKASYTELGAPQPLLDAANAYYDNLQQVADLRTVTDKIKKISISTLPDQAAALTDQLNTYFDGRLHAHDSGYGVIDVVAASVGKLPAVKWLAQRFSLSADEIMAFGDGDNDAALLAYAGQGLAMRNAAPTIQAIATGVTAYDNQQDGVLRAINDQILA